MLVRGVSDYFLFGGRPGFVFGKVGRDEKGSRGAKGDAGEKKFQNREERSQVRKRIGKELNGRHSGQIVGGEWVGGYKNLIKQ